ncbi:hypothetical protein ElyMa_003568500, partial [Elysia marginata]
MILSCTSDSYNCHVVPTPGLVLAFSPNWTLGGRKGCGTILCDEISNGSGNSTPAGDGSGTGDTAVLSHSISDMSLFKHPIQTMTLVRTDDGSARKRLVASLTSQQPSVTRVSNGIKVKGQLTAGRASLTLGLYKQEDCRAQYTCKVTKVDAQGRQHTASSRLVRQQTTEESKLQVLSSDAGWSPAVALTVLNLLHEIENKLVQVGSGEDDSWQPRVQALENRLEDKLTAIENRLQDRIASMENRLDNKLDHFGNRLEDKLA